MRGIVRFGRAVLTAAALTALTGVTAGTAQAQTEKPKIALYIASDKLKPEEKTVLTRKFLSPFTASGMYSVIDRSDIFTEKAEKERIKQRDGSVNEAEIRRIGYEAGAKYICMVELDNAFGKWNVAARMVDVETGEIYLAQGETDIAGDLVNADISVAAKVVFDQIHGRSAAQPKQEQTLPPQPQPQYAPQPQQQTQYAQETNYQTPQPAYSGGYRTPVNQARKVDYYFAPRYAWAGFIDRH